MLLDPLALAVIEGRFADGDRILVDAAESGLDLKRMERTAAAAGE